MNPDAPDATPTPEEDPILTAYALGALPAEEAAAVEARLERDPVARAFVEEMRALSGALAQEMAEEAEDEDAGLTTAQRRDLRQLIAKRAPSRMKFPRIGVICTVVAILLAMMMVMLWVALRKH